MFWATLWALILGFGLSGAVQAFVSRSEMERRLGRRGPREIGRATLFGAASSSCSYAASAMAKTLFQRGADFVSSMVFMFASTNLVIELGIVIWVLLGWEFALAEFVGGVIMIVLFTLSRPGLLEASRDRGCAREGRRRRTPARRRLESERLARPSPVEGGLGRRGELHVRRREDAAEGDGRWVRGGRLSHGARAGELLEQLSSSPATASGLLSQNVIVGPLIAILSFVCSVGNVPLAAALWHGGISFGGVISFIFADLITLPLLLIYRRYYGGRLTLKLLAIFWTVMSAAGLIVEYLFRGLGIEPTERPATVVQTSFEWNYTTFLNIVFLIVLAGLWWLARNQRRLGGGAGYAIDPMCGMQVEVANAPARSERAGEPVYFCSDHCLHRFEAAGRGVEVGA